MLPDGRSTPSSLRIIAESSPFPAGPLGPAYGRTGEESQASSVAKEGRPHGHGLRHRLIRQVREHWPFVILVSGTFAYIGLLSWILSQRYWAFQTFAWDLGNYNQGMYTTLFAHRLFYYTADLPSGNVGSLLAAHFSPILFLLLPFYALAPDPSGLLVLQAVVLGASALPLFFLARRTGLPERWSVLLAGAYLVSPVLMGIGWYDFHPEALLPVTVLFAIYAYYYGKGWTFAVAWILALTVIETVAPFLFLFAVGGLIAVAWNWFRHRPSGRRAWARPGIATLVPLAWLGLVVVFGLVIEQGNFGTLSTGYSSSYSVLGPNLTFFSVLPYAAIHPAAAVSALSFDAGAKAGYIAVLFASVAFLPLVGPKRLLAPAIVWIALVALSNGSSLYEFGDQYAAYPLPFLAAGAAFGLARLRAFWWARSREEQTKRPVGQLRTAWRRNARPVGVASLAVLAVVVSSALVSPLLPSPALSYDSVAHGLPTVTPHDLALHEILGLVPPTASILTVSPVFPEVSSRTHAYVVPISSNFAPGRTFGGMLGDYVNESTYVLLDYQLDFFGSSVLVRFANLSVFGLVAEESSILLLERGWTGPPRVWTPVNITWAGGELPNTSYSQEDRQNGTRYGPALSSVPNPPKGALLWSGPNLYGLVPGDYSVTFWASVNATAEGPLIRYDSVISPLNIELSQQGPTSAYHIYSFGFSTGQSIAINSTFTKNPSPLPYSNTTNLTVTFRYTGLSVWSVAGWVYAASTETHLFAVTLKELAPGAPAD